MEGMEWGGRGGGGVDVAGLTARPGSSAHLELQLHSCLGLLPLNLPARGSRRTGKRVCEGSVANGSVRRPGNGRGETVTAHRGDYGYR